MDGLAVEVVGIHDFSCGFVVPKEGGCRFNAADSVFSRGRGGGLLFGFVLFLGGDEYKWVIVVVISVVVNGNIGGVMVIIGWKMDCWLHRCGGIGVVGLGGWIRDHGGVSARRRSSDGHR